MLDNATLKEMAVAAARQIVSDAAEYGERQAKVMLEGCAKQEAELQDLNDTAAVLAGRTGMTLTEAKAYIARKKPWLSWMCH